MRGRANRACARPRLSRDRRNSSVMPTVQTIAVRDAVSRAAAPEAGTDELQDLHGEKMVLNMGPSHPATHGALRILLELDGEIITKAMPDIGYLHRGDAKIAENTTYTQF